MVSVDPTADDWYGDLFWIDRRKCLLLMHGGTMLAVLVPDVRKADLTPLGPFLVRHIQAALLNERLPPSTLGAVDATNVRVAKTASRAVLGCMRQDRWLVEHIVSVSGGLAACDASRLNYELRRTLHLPGGRGAVFPLDEARRRAHL